MKDNNIREYQQQIIDTIINRMKNNKKETLIEIPPGAGKHVIIKRLIEILTGNVLVITKTIMSKLQFTNFLKDCKNVRICTYNNFIDEDIKYKYIILIDLEAIPESLYNIIYKMYKNANLIGFFDKYQTLEEKEDWLSKKDIAYHLTLQEIIEKGYINPFQGETKLLNFVEKMLKNLGLVNINKEEIIRTEKGIIRPDFIVDNNENKIIIEVKNYRSEYISNDIINRAVNQLYYNIDSRQYPDTNSILIVSCRVAEEIKQQYYKDKRVLIIDISNLIYLSQDDKELMKILAEAISYDIYPITPIKPIEIRLFKLHKKAEFKEETSTSQAINFINQLQSLNAGNKDGNAQKYQELCVKIIKFLFEAEFTKISEQDSTEDKMFRRDLLCGIKGSSEFWKILIQHYNSRFVVFEFKNYEQELDQNLVYITGKYLYNAALRNVAIIISRKGFSDSAHKLAIGMLTGKEEKLIIDLNDKDIIIMLRMKADEQDPSDYLLNKLEDFLMSMST